MSRTSNLLALLVVGASIAVSPTARAQDDAAVAQLAVAADAFTTCLTATVRMGMITKMDPDQFKQGFAKSCMEEQAAFRSEAIKMTVAQGRTEAEAIAEIDQNIANGRRIFAADQEAYVKTGKVPK